MIVDEHGSLYIIGSDVIAGTSARLGFELKSSGGAVEDAGVERFGKVQRKHDSIGAACKVS